MNGTDAPLVTVCIANYNGEHMLRECIDSVLAQGTEAKIETIVHDDASTDGSLELLAGSYPMLRVIRSETNVGFCVANNRMAELARGRFLLLLNNDAALSPDAISTLLDAAKAMDAPAILTIPQHDWITGEVVDRGCLVDPFFNPIPNLDPAREDVAYVIGACLWCPRETWKDLGGFPEWMESIGEDLFICSKARLMGIPVRALGSSFYRHRQGASFGGNRADTKLRTSLRRRALSERNKTRALLVLTPGVTALALLAAHSVLLAAEGVALSMLKRDFLLLRKVYFPAILGPLRELAFLLSCRRETQSLRTLPINTWYSTTRCTLRKIELLRRYGIPELD